MEWQGHGDVFIVEILVAEANCAAKCLFMLGPWME
jgi:hypothetical protein